MKDEILFNIDVYTSVMIHVGVRVSESFPFNQILIDKKTLLEQ